MEISRVFTFLLVLGVVQSYPQLKDKEQELKDQPEPSYSEFIAPNERAELNIELLKHDVQKLFVRDGSALSKLSRLTPGALQNRVEGQSTDLPITKPSESSGSVEGTIQISLTHANGSSQVTATATSSSNQSVVTALVQSTVTPVVQSTGIQLIRSPATSVAQSTVTQLVQAPSDAVVETTLTQMIQTTAAPVVQTTVTQLVRAPSTPVTETTVTKLVQEPSTVVTETTVTKLVQAPSTAVTETTVTQLVRAASTPVIQTTVIQLVQSPATPVVQTIVTRLVQSTATSIAEGTETTVDPTDVNKQENDVSSFAELVQNIAIRNRDELPTKQVFFEQVFETLITAVTQAFSEMDTLVIPISETEELSFSGLSSLELGEVTIQALPSRNRLILKALYKIGPIEAAVGPIATLNEGLDETSIDETSIDETSIDVPSIDVPSIDVPSIDVPSIDVVSIDEASTTTFTLTGKMEVRIRNNGGSYSVYLNNFRTNRLSFSDFDIPFSNDDELNDQVLILDRFPMTDFEQGLKEVFEALIDEQSMTDNFLAIEDFLP